MRESRSPWLEHLPVRPAAPSIDGDSETDVAVVGAGIAGVATAFFLLRCSDRSVVLLERDRVARGASGFNAGQLVGYFERPLCRLASEFGFARALAGQRDVLEGWRLLEQVVEEARVREAVHRFTGHMGMFALDHLSVHLENNALRAQAGLPREQILVSEKAAYLADIPDRYAPLYELVPQAAVDERLETEGTGYSAVLCEPKGCTSSASLCEEVVAHLRATYPQRFRLAEHTSVDRIGLHEDHAILACGPHRVRAARVVLCTNGFAGLAVEDHAGSGGAVPPPGGLRGTVGFMAGFFEPLRAPSAISYLASPRIGQGQAYYYVTRRPIRIGGEERTFTCVGGPDAGLEDARGRYDPAAPVPPEILQRLDRFIRPILAPGRGEPLRYDYAWHGLMAYTDDQARVVGAEPRNPVLLYNLGCNGVGLLPSLHGGRRIARLLAGERLPPSLFDPR